jgi:hypothetical protein
MKSLKRWLLQRLNTLMFFTGIQELHDVILESKYQETLKNSKNPLLVGGYYPGFSQVDEDSIIHNIASRIYAIEQNEGSREFVELGVGDGTQNNTLALLLNGWKGLWFGGQDMVLASNQNLKFHKVWITLESLRNEVIPSILKIKNLNLLSLDLDGNDYWIAKELLKNNVHPDIWIQEYNSLFPPNIKWTIPYDDKHVCKYDGYWGASLGAFVELFESSGYFLVACNVSGANAFFVKEKFRDKFLDIPSDVNLLYMPNRAWLYKSKRKLSNRISLGINPSETTH